MFEQSSRSQGPTRRTITKVAAWAVPAILIAAPVPAFAASGVAGNVAARCESGAFGAFDISVTGAGAGAIVQIVFAWTAGDGSFGVTAPASWGTPTATATSYTYLVPTVGGALTGTATVNFELDQNGTATVTATISATSGPALSGDLRRSLFKRRNGSSGNYQCSAG